MSRVLIPNGKISMITASMLSFLPEWIKRSSLTRKRHHIIGTSKQKN